MEELVAKRVAEELERRKDEIEAEVLRRLVNSSLKWHALRGSKVYATDLRSTIVGQGLAISSILNQRFLVPPLIANRVCYVFIEEPFRHALRVILYE